MIERYALYDIDKLRDQFNLADGVPKGVKKRYNILPAQKVPVILQREGKRVMEMMQWGFVPQNAKDTNSIFRYKTFVAHSEDTFTTVMWERSIASMRCLVPVNGFYVWSQRTGTKVPYYFQMKQQPVFALAGIYSSWTNSDGVESGMVSIITFPTDNATNLPSRLPVIVRPEQEELWLNTENEDKTAYNEVMRTVPEDSLSIRRVGDGIFSKKLDTPELIVAVNS